MVRAREEGVRDQGKAAEVEKRAWIQGTFGGVCHNKCSDGDEAGRPASSARGVGPHLLALRYFFLATDTSAGLS